MAHPEADSNAISAAASETPLGTMPLADVDLSRPEIIESGFPHELFTRLRREAPVLWHPMPEGLPIETDEGFWVLSKYEDIQAANRDTETFCSIDGPGLSLSPELRGAMLVSMDGQAHIRQRKIISAGFTPRMVGRLEKQARRWAVSIIENALEKGSCDFVADIAYQLPMHMIADIVGIPLEDRQWLFTLTNDFLQGVDFEDRGSDKAVAASMAKQVEMFQYAQKLCERKRKSPEDDVWTIISTFELEDEKEGRSSMSEIELNFFFMLLTIAGSETTRNAISGRSKRRNHAVAIGDADPETDEGEHVEALVLERLDEANVKWPCGPEAYRRGERELQESPHAWGKDLRNWLPRQKVPHRHDDERNRQRSR